MKIINRGLNILTTIFFWTLAIIVLVIYNRGAQIPIIQDILFLGLVAYLLLIALLLVVSKHLIVPWNQIIKGAEEFSKGNFKHRLDIKNARFKEFKTLFSAYNKTGAEMVRVLNRENKNQTTLKKQIASKTNELHKKISELEKFNKFAINRELKMIELKKQIKELKNEKRRN